MDKFAALSYGLSLIIYVQNKVSFDEIIIYDDLLQDPEGRTKVMFERLGVNTDLVRIALTALSKDSQMKFFGKTDGRKTSDLNAHQWARIDAMLEAIEVPITHNTTLDEFRELMANPNF